MARRRKVTHTRKKNNTKKQTKHKKTSKMPEHANQTGRFLGKGYRRKGRINNHRTWNWGKREHPSNKVGNNSGV